MQKLKTEMANSMTQISAETMDIPYSSSSQWKLSQLMMKAASGDAKRLFTSSLSPENSRFVVKRKVKRVNEKVFIFHTIVYR